MYPFYTHTLALWLVSITQPPAITIPTKICAGTISTLPASVMLYGADDLELLAIASALENTGKL
jgi:Asp-tRNA(Asn)/Glu-tRNA(Gln) amidotransferase A subunit family amidase